MKRKYMEENKEIPIHSFLKCIMSLTTLQHGKDYTIRVNQLRIIKHPVRGKVLSILKEYYPEYHYYWETPKLLIWFK